MPIQPMDLQVLFSRLDNISRDTMGERNMLAQSQAVAGSEIAEKSQELARAVTTSEDVSEGPDTVREDDDDGQGSHNGRRKQNEEPRAQAADETLFRDPDLGGTIDISG